MLNSVNTPVSSEYFAASADVHLVLGHIASEDYSTDTPDTKEKTRIAALRRLARVVCADLDEIGEHGAYQIAAQFWNAQKDLIRDQVWTVMEGSCSTSLLTAGIGASLFARELDGTELSRRIGEAADALPAYAVREVARRDSIFSRG
jgi:hypothetical protein